MQTSTFSATCRAPAFREFTRGAEALMHDPHAIGGRLERLLAQDGWLAAEHQAPGTDSYRQHLLYVSPCRGLSVVSLVWRPGQRTPIHDHVAWCIVGVYRGLEHETRYRLVESGRETCLVAAGSVEARPGHVETLVPPVDNIHMVTAAGSGLTISIHVYGADIERLGSSIHRRFDDLAQLPQAA